jgi:hypothetical protein
MSYSDPFSIDWVREKARKCRDAIQVEVAGRKQQLVTV